MFSTLVGVCLWLTMIVCAAPVHAAPQPPDPLSGDWIYYKNHAVTFFADGTAVWRGKGGFQGTWEYLHNPEVQRHYRIVWAQGKSVDDLTLSEDGQRAHVHSETGERLQYDVRRAIESTPAAVAPSTTAPPMAAATTPAVAAAGPADPNDPVIGDWVWGTNGPVTFKADGTVASPKGRHGVWQYLHNPGATRQYVVTWGNGNFIDKLTYAPGAPSGHVVGKRGAEYEATRSKPGDPAPAANPFGTAGH